MVVLLFLINGTVFASNITPYASTITVNQFDESGYDSVILTPPNDSGISYNRFVNFDVDRPLNIVNVPKKDYDTDSVVEEAQLIVIEAENLSIQSEIELVGRATDVIFISPTSDGLVECINCQLTNFNRITLAVAEIEGKVLNSLPNIGELDALSGGKVYIDNVIASGAISLDVLADTITHKGHTTTHQRVFKDFSGKYTNDINGNLTVGIGSTHLMLGKITWDYDAQKISSVERDAQRTRTPLYGKITSTKVKISSSHDIGLATLIDTRSDLLSSVRYKEQNRVAKESLDIQTFDDNKKSFIRSNLYSQGSISIKTNGALVITDEVVVQSPKINLIVGETFFNKSSIESDVINLAANHFVNHGYVYGLKTLSIWSKNNLVNEFGGELVGRTIRLQTENGFVRNGSRTPWVSDVEEIENRLFYTGYDINEAYNNSTSELGTYYKEELGIEDDKKRVRAEVTHAYISGVNIQISGNGFENINPYWESVGGDNDSIELKQHLMNQVVVSAESHLKVVVNTPITNSSAIIKVNQSDGIMELSAPSIANDRYRTLSLLEAVSSESGPSCGFICFGWQDKTLSSETDTVSVKIYAYSPPGIIFSAGHLNMDASLGFLNNVSYLEVMGNAQFKTSSINDIGYETQSMTRTVSEVIKREYICDRRNNSNNNNLFNWLHGGAFIWSVNVVVPKLTPECYKDNQETITNITVPHPEELDSLFFIHGHAVGSDDSFTSKNHQPFEFFERQAIDAVEEEVIASVLAQNSSANVLTSSEVNEDDIIVSWTDSSNGTSGTKVFSLVDALIELYNEIVELINDLLEELDWWEDE
jgi:hypothetical protein